MRYDFIREGMKESCYKRENGKRIVVFFLFINLLILFGIEGKRFARKKIEK